MLVIGCDRVSPPFSSKDCVNHSLTRTHLSTWFCSRLSENAQLLVSVAKNGLVRVRVFEHGFLMGCVVRTKKSSDRSGCATIAALCARLRFRARIIPNPVMYLCLL